MDPNACLAEIRRLLDQLANLNVKDWEGENQTGKVYRLCELVEALDGWLSKGGFLPHEWRVFERGSNGTL